MVNDPIADLVNRVRTAGTAGLESIKVPHSKLKMSVAELLAEKGYVKYASLKGKEPKKWIEIGILYDENKRPRITGAKRVSKLGRRIYKSSDEIRAVKQGHGLAVLSTPKGVMTGDEAKAANVGGEALFEIW